MKAKVQLVSILSIVLFGYAVFAAYAGERTFKVNKGGTLKVSISNGDVNISTWDRNEVRVSYDEDDQFEIEQRGNIIEIEDENYYGGENLEVNIPSQFNVDLQTQSGDIKIKGTLIGSVEAATSGGDIEVNEVIGMVDLKTAGGNVTTGNIKGDAEINSAGGDLVLGNIDGIAELKTAGGNVTVKEVSRSLDIKTGGGNVIVAKNGEKIEVISGGGNITINSAAGVIDVKTGGGNITIKGGNGEAKLITGGGNVTINNLNGSLNAATGGGNITAQFNEVKGNSKIATGMGDVRLYIPENAKATIIIRLSDSWSTDLDENLDRIKSDFELHTAEKYEDDDVFTATYKINGGGSTIKIDTGEGTVHLKKNK